MKPLDDIVFENRNQEYGSYDLRKKYGNFLIAAMAAAIFLTGVVIAFPVIASYLNKEKPETITGKVIVDVNQINDPNPLPPSPPDLPKEMSVPKFVAPEIVDENVESTMGIQDVMAGASPQVPDISGDLISIPAKPVNEPVIETPKEPEYYTIVQEEPKFNGDLYAFLYGEIKYPFEAKELGIQGKVYVSFIVETDGSVSTVELLRGIGGGCDEEAIRVVKMMPKWSPGKQGGVAVRVKFSLPVKFTLQ